MKRIMEREEPLEEKLSQIFDGKKKVAAAVALAAVTQMLRQAYQKEE